MVPSNPPLCYPPALPFLQTDSSNTCMGSQCLLCYPHDTEIVSHFVHWSLLNIVTQYQTRPTRSAYFWTLCPACLLFSLLFIAGSPLNFLHWILLFQSSFPCHFSVAALRDPLLSLLQGAVISALPFATSYCCNVAEVSL